MSSLGRQLVPSCLDCSSRIFSCAAKASLRCRSRSSVLPMSAGLSASGRASMASPNPSDISVVMAKKPLIFSFSVMNAASGWIRVQASCASKVVAIALHPIRFRSAKAFASSGDVRAAITDSAVRMPRTAERISAPLPMVDFCMGILLSAANMARRCAFVMRNDSAKVAR